MSVKAEKSPEGRIPPQDVEAEQAVLGAVLISPEAAAEVLEGLTEADFYRPAHRHIFSAMAELFERGEAIDLVTVRGLLQGRDQLDQVGGSAYLTQLSDTVFSAANVSAYIGAVHSRSVVRQLLARSEQIAAQCYTHAGEVDELLDRAEQAVFEIADKKAAKSLYPLKDVVHASVQYLERLYEQEEPVTGVPSGFVDLDELTTGFHPSDLIVVAGRPSMGKTAFALSVSLNAAFKDQRPVALFSLEMSKEQLALRLISAESGLDAKRLRKGTITEQDFKKILDASGRLYEAPIFIDETPALTPLHMRAKARRLKARHGLGLVVVDYLQLMRGGIRTDNRVQEISEISRSLKELARELKVPVIALSQLNREIERRDDKRPRLSDLRESGAIEQDADLIMFIYRDEVYHPDSSPFAGTAEIIVGKQRNGPTGDFWLMFEKESTRFKNLDREAQRELRDMRRSRGRRFAKKDQAEG
ncbi:MAG: replicative DNA helicase [Proteobacteria bacterium]|nr:replicative DNA helicase [Pseudomonadota bacterium]MBU1741509.1 replicative DNA helicase [Pseudomonadota bacterium]